MSSTRRVEAGERRRQDGWASSPEFDVLRGLNGTAVALKAALQDAPEKRELLFFLQALSLRDGGLKRIAREMVEIFHERIGTPTMLKIGCKPGKRLTKEQHCEIYKELYGRDDDVWDDILDRKSREERALASHSENAAAEFCQECRERATKLDDFIEELCCDPKMEVSRQSDSELSYRNVVRIVLDDARNALREDSKLSRERPHLKSAVEHSNDFRAAELPYFQDVLGALFEYKRRHEARARAEYVETSMTKIVFAALEYVRDTRRSALIEGNSGFGKTTGLKACCEMNLGQMRYHQLTAITTRTNFFRGLAKTFGVASGGGMSSGKIQARVEEFLKRTKLILVIDEGQYLWPQAKRIESHPELVNWLNTACYNEGVPYVISATKQFTIRRQAAEKGTDWSSEQSRRRTRKIFPLPDMPTPKEPPQPWHAAAVARMKNDLLIVATAKLVPLGLSACAEYVAGYALASRGYFQTITDAIEDAQLIAKRAGRGRVTTKDFQTAVNEYRMPSDAALVRVFDSKAEGRRHNSRVGESSAPQSAPVSAMVNEPLTTNSMGVNEDFRPLESGRRSTRPEAAPVLTG